MCFILNAVSNFCSTWPALSMIANHNSIERTIFEAVEALRSECRKQNSNLHHQSIVRLHPEFRALANLHMLQLSKPFDLSDSSTDAICLWISSSLVLLHFFYVVLFLFAYFLKVIRLNSFFKIFQV